MGKSLSPALRPRCFGSLLPKPLRGFTLVEILITLGLLVIVLGLLFVPIASSFGYFRTATARADAQTAARTALDAMARELAEAMVVQLDMYDDSMIAFVPPLRVNPDDPNSEVVTPPRPDLSRAIRYWQALTDPTRNYNPGAYLEPSNMLFLARTVVPYPFKTDDTWNRWNDQWADTQDANGVGKVTDWAPIPRAVHTDYDYRGGADGNGNPVFGTRNRTTQPGFPYLAVMYGTTGNKLTPDQVRAYRNAVVAMTPNAPEYDVPQLSFTATVAAGERLQRVESADGPDGSAYRARYPLWRQGLPYTGWSSLPADLVSVIVGTGMSAWARDPFFLISRYMPGVSADTGRYYTQAVAAFDPRTRTMKVMDLGRGGLLHDTFNANPEMPYGVSMRTPATEQQSRPRFIFGVDWVDGSLRFDYPMTVTVSNMSALSSAMRLTATGSQWQAPLSLYWDPTNSDGYNPGENLYIFVVPDSVTVRRVRMVQDATTKQWSTTVLSTLKQVFCTPREGRDEYQLGTVKGDSDVPYGCIRLPNKLTTKDPASAEATAAATATSNFIIEYRWRSNGVIAGVETEEKPDIVTAFYRTAAIIDIGVTVSRADPSAEIGKRISQSSYLTRRVKLHNVLREVRHAER